MEEKRINVLVPKDLFYDAKIRAMQCRMNFTEYIINLIKKDLETKKTSA